MTKVIGLTGGIATGKSTVASYLKVAGWPVYDLDQITHEIEAHNQPVIHEIAAHFGDEVIDNHQVNRHRLGEIVWQQPEKLRTLVRILTPALLAAMEERTKGSLTIFEAAALFENGFHPFFDQIVLLTCDPVLRLKRLQQRNHISLSAANQLIKTQWPQDLKLGLVDAVFDSSHGTKSCAEQLQKWLAKLE
ncbi:dephospho-CoA kinase [Fructilactobacillus florum]|uniref:Dephospho-CoA kinase n=1 Tax=Fructilactobacillus florum DSM 22689 = JCM 16035 TaxID=1423745 RepID=A0A0R2CL61_9LACO|nr:dephospho-CoA kinase [Fructilactobacillus florum]KRM91842.1 hypothetical protein FC87_GL000667 [Fructilactobacillus florum DSM 22689 = JCM 16035]